MIGVPYGKYEDTVERVHNKNINLDMKRCGERDLNAVAIVEALVTHILYHDTKVMK